MSKSSSVQVDTRSYAWDLPFVKTSKLFTHAAACDHSGHNKAVPSPFERKLLKQGFILSHALDGYKAGATKHIFLKPSKALQEAIDHSPYAGMPCEWISLDEVGEEDDRRIMIKLTMVSRTGIYFTYSLMAGFLTLADFAELKESLKIKPIDHCIELN